MDNFAQDIKEVRMRYRRGLCSEANARQAFAEIYAETFGIASGIYREMRLGDFEECFYD